MRIDIPTLLACIAITTSPVGYAQMTIENAIASALSHDPTIDKIHADVSEALGFTREVRADLLPQLSLEGRIGFANRDRGSIGGDSDLSRRATITGRQHIWDGGFNMYRWQDATKRVEAQERLVKAQREATAIGAVEAFLDVIRARKQIEFARQSVSAHEKVLDLAKKRAQAAGNQADIELSDARFDLARTLLLERQLALKQAEAAFVRWTGRKPSSELVTPRTPDISSLSDIDPKRNFHYLATLKQHEAATLEKLSFEKRYGPKFFLEATAGLGQEVLGTRGRDNDVSVLVVGSWEILDGGRRRGQVEQAAADIERQCAIMRETLVLLNQDITARWEDYRTIRQRLGILRDYADALEKTVTLYQQQFDLGTRPLLSLLDIQNELIAASIRIADGQRDRTFLGYRLLFFGGRLIRETVGAKYLEGNPRAKSKPDPTMKPIAYLNDPAPKAPRAAATAIAQAAPKPFRNTVALRAATPDEPLAAE